MAKDGYRLLYDLGWSLVELVTPVAPLRGAGRFLRKTQEILHEVYATAEPPGALPLERHHDGDDGDVLVRSAALEELYWELNGPALGALAHIAAIHYHIDLVSLEEGIEWITRLNAYFQEQDWPQGERIKPCPNCCRGP